MEQLINEIKLFFKYYLNKFKKKRKLNLISSSYNNYLLKILIRMYFFIT